MRDQAGRYVFAVIMWLAARGWLGSQMKNAHDVVLVVVLEMVSEPSPGIEQDEEFDLGLA